MSQEVFYRQCRLQRRVGECTYEQVSFIPEPHCVVGKVLKLRTGHQTWDDEWIVVTAGERQPASHVEARARDHLKTRPASDV
jgi:hypothetical protein